MAQAHISPPSTSKQRMRCVFYNPRFGSNHAEQLAQRMPGIDLTVWTPAEAASLTDATVLLTAGVVDPRPVLAHAPGIRWIHSISAGVEGLLVPEVVESDIVLTNSSGCMSIPIAEHVIACMLAFARQFPALIKQQATRSWDRPPATEVGEATVGIIGYGSIGQEVAKRAQALGMNVLAVRRNPGAGQEPYAHQVYGLHEVDTVLQAADYVVNALPFTPETLHFFNRERIGQMKRSAVFINIGRGTTVAEAELVAALEQGTIAGAALDVFTVEPLPADSPLWDMPNVFVTPHTSFLSPRTQARVIDLLVENIRRFEGGLPLLNVVDKRSGY